MYQFKCMVFCYLVAFLNIFFLQINLLLIFFVCVCGCYMHFVQKRILQYKYMYIHIWLDH